jgi:hypothetical protein
MTPDEREKLYRSDMQFLLQRPEFVRFVFRVIQSSGIFNLTTDGSEGHHLLSHRRNPMADQTDMTETRNLMATIRPTPLERLVGRIMRAPDHDAGGADVGGDGGDASGGDDAGGGEGTASGAGDAGKGDGGDGADDTSLIASATADDGAGDGAGDGKAGDQDGKDDQPKDGADRNEDGTYKSGFRQLLEDTGLTNHPDMARVLRAVGAGLAEDGTFARSDGKVEKKSREEVLYPDDVPKK